MKKIGLFLTAALFAVFTAGCSGSVSETSTQSAYGSELSNITTIADIKNAKSFKTGASAVSLFNQFLDNNTKKNTYRNSSFYFDGEFLFYDNPEYDTAVGIDVSVFQGEIDWEKVKAQGMSFAFVRIGIRGYGEAGSLNEDPMFRQNIEGAKNAGIPVGAYFFSQAINEAEAEEEAEFSLSLLEGISLDLPLVYDAEIISDDDARTDNVPINQFTKNALAFCRKVESAGYDAMIYANLTWEVIIYDISQLSDYPLWYAGYNDIPLSPFHFEFWQYTESGRLDGIESSVDLNIWMRKAAEPSS